MSVFGSASAVLLVGGRFRLDCNDEQNGNAMGEKDLFATSSTLASPNQKAWPGKDDQQSSVYPR